MIGRQAGAAGSRFVTLTAGTVMFGGRSSTSTEPDHLTQRQCFGQIFGEQQINYKNLFSVQYDFPYLLGTILVPHIGQVPPFGQSQSDRDVFRLRLAALGMTMTWKNGRK